MKDLSPQIVMGIGVSSFILFKKLFREVQESFSDLICYDADIDLTVRYAAAHNVFMMARCEVTAENSGKVTNIKCLDDTEELDPKLPNLRIFHLRADTDPAHKEPKFLIAKFGKSSQWLAFNKPKELVHLLNAVLVGYDPDVILTRFGDGWLLPKLLELSQNTGIPLSLNRDLSLPVLKKKETDFFNYGRAHYRATQIH